MATVLALLAWEGQPEPDQAAQAFDAARTPLRFVTLAGCNAIACCPYFSSGCPRPEGVARAELHALHDLEPPEIRLYCDSEEAQNRRTA